ncbi:hypothetical protein P154DRAFT_527387 [Amniculicola lignicola CBS 123094]|uniref:F-box domain-containing protein n=1 Tax=Amniculicola lignicola CBS 123094 TaxID=1392246 RepID=A0A6A5VZ47_9PLEO|nr:hypothetical protein P154DRAFT_527387 [Amniculicola lignicola CBS 123094]
MAPMKPPLAGLLDIPTELLLEIVSRLRTPDLRRLGRVNHALYSFVGHYLVRYRYNSGLLSLPNELILAIVQHLNNGRDRSRFARVSLRVYPLVMDYIVRHNVRHGRSHLLSYAARLNLEGMARKILHIGGDVNVFGGHRFANGIINEQLTPLSIAAYYGYEGMVRLLLGSGASRTVNGIRMALFMAMVEHHETVAIMLSRNLDLSDMISETRMKISALQLACREKLVNLVQYYLNRGSKRGRLSKTLIRDRSIALRMILLRDASRESFVKREIHEDVYKIVLLLLQSGADPDYRVVTARFVASTARVISSRHPDPRVRVLFAKSASAIGPEESSLLIGRRWLSESADEAVELQGVRSESPPIELSTFARLSDFVKEGDIYTFNFLDESEIEEGDDQGAGTRDTYPDLSLDDTDMADWRVGELHWRRRNSEHDEPPPLSVFPQLGNPTSVATHVSKDFWSNGSALTKMSFRPMQTLNVGASPSRKAEQFKKPTQVEPFPQLGESPRTSNVTAVNVWASFTMNKASSGPGESSRREQPLNPKNPGKASKKKKWERVVL